MFRRNFPIRFEVLTNFVAQGYGAVIGLVFIPIYIKLMGIESYGLVGLFVCISGVLSILDLGLGTTVVHDLARMSAAPKEAQQSRDLVRTLEYIYWLTAGLICIAVAVAAPWVTHYWVKPDRLSDREVQQAVATMGLAIACRWPTALYLGALRGIQRTALVNLVISAAATLRAVGSLLVLLLVSPTIEAFLAWQVVSNFLATCGAAFFLWIELPKTSERSRFDTNILKSIWRLSAGLSGVTVVNVLLTQTDKIVLSKVLNLEEFGYYAFASAAASALLGLVTPIQLALFPRFSQLVSLGESRSLKDLYHAGCQAVSVFAMTAAIVVAVFSSQVLWVWTGDPAITEKSYLVLAILAVSTGVSGIMHLPFSLQVSCGWISLHLLISGASALALFPLVFVMAAHFGITGAALACLVTNAFGSAIIIHFMHKQILLGEEGRWYGLDVGLPSFAALVVALAYFYFLPDGLSRIAMMIYLGAALGSGFAGAAICAPAIRSWMAERIGISKRKTDNS
jgi:O-antigen/teichoic acid export membrane protein